MLRAFWIGSPLHMRGKEVPTSLVSPAQRITPAYAGKRLASVVFLMSRMYHPCVCGEKVAKAVDIIVNKGSPLRMRGKGQHDTEYRSCKGITPAYAGKRFWILLVSCTYGDHPCVCGEKHRHNYHLPFRNGSPLRMRGKG